MKMTTDLSGNVIYDNDVDWQCFENFCKIKYGSFSPDPDIGLHDSSPQQIVRQIQSATRNRCKNIVLEDILFKEDVIEVVGYVKGETNKKRLFSIGYYPVTDIVLGPENDHTCRKYIEQNTNKNTFDFYVLKRDPNLTSCSITDIYKVLKNNNGKNHRVEKIKYCILF